MTGINFCTSMLLMSVTLITLPPESLCEVVWAVNCGGGKHIDSDGIHYAADHLEDGIASDYGRSFTINRVPVQDQIIYQTERYNTGDFTYTVPINEPGNYVLTLKFSEVWFTSPMQKVFNVRVNDEIDVINDLDIFQEVGFATALNYDIPFRVNDGLLYIGDRAIVMPEDFLTVTFVKTDFDNPKVNAIVLTKGETSGVSSLPPVDKPAPDMQRERQRPPEVDPVSEPQKVRPSGIPRAPDPYSSTDYSYLIIPVLVSVAAFVPIVFCLCRL